MKILLAAVSSAMNPDGVARHAANLARCLLKRSEIARVDLVIGAWQEGLFLSLLNGLDTEIRLSKLVVHLASSARFSLARNLWYYRELPRIARSLGSDVVHLTYPVPVDRERLECPVVVTLHDLYPYDLPENFGYPRVFLNRLVLRHCLASVDAIACVSETTRGRLRLRFAEHLEKATCIYNCVEMDLSAWSLVHPLLPGPFLLMVAQHRRSKNVRLGLEVFRRVLLSNPTLTLLVVGNEGPETPGIRALLDDPLLRGQVMLSRGLTEQQMQWCYRSCELLFAPSVMEGFGLPVVEAMLVGCPVVCSDIPAFREFGERHCDFVRLDDGAEQAFLNAIRGALERRRPRPASLPQLSPSAIAARYMQLYGSLLVTPRTLGAAIPRVEQRTRGAA